MTKVICSYCEDSFDSAKLTAVEKAIKQIYKKHFNVRSSVFIWMPTKQDQIYTNRKPSKCMIIMMEVANNLEQTKRYNFLKEVSETVAPIINCKPDDLILSGGEKAYVDNYLKLQRDKIALNEKIPYLLFLGWNLLWGKVSQQRFIYPVNYKI